MGASMNLYVALMVKPTATSVWQIVLASRTRQRVSVELTCGHDVINDPLSLLKSDCLQSTALLQATNFCFFRSCLQSTADCQSNHLFCDMLSKHKFLEKWIK